MNRKKKKNLSAKAIRLLRRVEKHILAEPLRYDQTIFIEKRKGPACGTAGCIAGWIAAFDTLGSGNPTKAALSRLANPTFYKKARSIANDALGLGLEDTWSLFSPRPLEAWPQPFNIKWREAALADDQRACARIAANRIEHFIKTDGAE